MHCPRQNLHRVDQTMKHRCLPGVDGSGWLDCKYVLQRNSLRHYAFQNKHVLSALPEARSLGSPCSSRGLWLTQNTAGCGVRASAESSSEPGFKRGSQERRGASPSMWTRYV